MINQPSDQSETNFLVNLSNPARRALGTSGYTRLEQLTAVGEAEIKQLHGIGPNVISLLHHALAAKGLAFASGKAKKVD